MSSEPQFLSFKGLKQYTPEEGWGQVNAILQSHTQPQEPAPMPEPPQASPQQFSAVPDNVPTLTETPDASGHAAESPMFDPLIHELFHKLDQDLTNLRGTILSHLADVQHAADQQLTSARLRAEVSALAQTKLAAKLTTKR